MGSSLSWLDYSDAERRTALDVIEMFRDRDTRDELGLGSIRDAFADRFFPGTSTIQTRVAYFLLIPWLYRSLEAQNLGRPNVADRARKAELSLIAPLLAGGDQDGVIGSRARLTLKRLPGDVYWQGLAAWGIRLFPGSRDQYLRRLASLRSERRTELDDDGEPLADAASLIHWHPGLPEPPDDFPETASLRLRGEDRSYLRERVLLGRPRSTLLAWLVDQSSPSNVTFAWDHPEFDRFPSTHRDELQHARMLACVMQGAALLYNLLLARRRSWEEKIVEFGQRLAGWYEALEAEAGGSPRDCDLQELWRALDRTSAAVTLPTRAFVESWTRIVVEGDDLATSPRARELIIGRERQVKGLAASRLHSDAALQLWGGDAGSARMNYRWGIAQRYINDLAVADA